MSVRFLFALAVGLAFVAPAFAADPAPVPLATNEKARPGSLEAALAVLHDQIPPNLDDPLINHAPLFEILQKLGKGTGVNFSLNEPAFRAEGIPDIKVQKSDVAATSLQGLTGHQYLSVVLESLNATYLVTGGRIEIVPVKYAATLTKSKLTDSEDGPVTLAEPLVSMNFKEKPFNEAVAMIAERYDLTVVVSPQSGDGRTGFVTARLLNIPADKALELLAVQCDLRVVRKGNAFLITSRDHANDMFNEKLERERQVIEVQKLREAPARAPEPAKPAEAPKP